ncbi:MAG: phosphoribosylformylglycinamidine synthase subunit PurL [Thermodesulfobacteriota bacterium]
MGTLRVKEKTEITRDLIKIHGFNDEEYRRILDILDREPNLVELGIFSVMWSEHCSYKSSRVHLKELPTKGPRVIQGPGENAGIVDIGDGLAAVFKMESHNHPSYIEPYQGAATGVGGILRDIFTMGARPIASLNSLRFGSFDHPKTRYLLKGVVAGIAGYGNCMGVPTVGGEIAFHESYNGNCLVNAMTLGIVKKEGIFRGKACGAGNPVIYVGSKTGRDGIHGATMASEGFGEGGEERRPTVQVGDPFTEKLLLEACLEVFNTGYVVGVQDMGAAGLTSSSVEMASRGGMGMEIDTDMVPRREEGMSPYEVMLSESQERMLFVVEAGREKEVEDIFEKWDLDAKVIGRVTEDGLLRLKEKGEVAAEIPINSLTDEAPLYNRPIKRPAYLDAAADLNLDEIPIPEDMNSVLLTLISSPNLASREWVFKQYDYMVRTDTVVLPGSDAAVVRIKGTDKALALTVDCNSRYCYLDPYTGGMIAVSEGVRNLACVGAEPIGLTDCLNFGDPEEPEIMWQFKNSILGIKDACLAFNVPVIGGNVSFYNETSGNAIYPTPTIAMVGLIENLSLITTHWFKEEGDIIVILGRADGGLGGSEYLASIHGKEKGRPPKVDMEMEKKVSDICREAIKKGMIRSAHDCSEGGVAVSLTESCMSGNIGADVSIKGFVRSDILLFGEAQSRIIVSVKKGDLKQLGGLAEEHGAPLEVIGKVGGTSLRINEFVNIPVSELKKMWEEGLEREL